MTQRRLIEETFPLQKVSEDSKHEKNVRHGHISTLHIWPARRPLAACRAAIIAALMPDPGTEQERHALNGGGIEGHREFLSDQRRWTMFVEVQISSILMPSGQQAAFVFYGPLSLFRRLFQRPNMIPS